MEQNKYNQLREVIYEACPHKVRARGGYAVFEGGKHIKDVDTGDITPIRLADVLLAMNADKENIWGYYLDLNGKLVEEYEYEFGMELNPTNFQWNLKDDNLDNQSEETKEFLYELLVK